MADGDFKQEDFDRILKLLHNRLTFGLVPVEQPTAFLLGGQAGAGKSGSQQVLSNKCNNNVVIVPNHKGDIPKGTLNSIFKQAGLK